LPSNTEKTNELTDLNDFGTFERQDFGDRKIEIVGLSTTHMSAIHVGFSGYRIAQCRQLRIELCCPMTT
jgi:hypothetical protein